MKTTMTMMLGALLTLTAWSTDASALDFCPDGSGCKAGEVCHGGVCLPAAMICTSDANCAAYEKCDFSCPHGGSTNSTTVDTSPPSQGEGGSGSSDGSEGGADFKAPAEGESDGDVPPEGGEAKKPGAAEPEPPVESTCPKDKGVCIVATAQIVVDASCKSFCAVASKCGFESKVSGGSSTGNATPGVPPTSTTPAPDPDGDDGGGSAGAPANPDDSKDPEAPDQAPPDNENTEVPVDEPGDKLIAADNQACETLCMVWKYKKVAEKELTAVMQCLAANEAKTCDEIDKGCESEGKAFVDAIKDDETVGLAMGGGFGWASGSNSDAPAADPKVTGDSGQPVGANQESAGQYSPAGAAGCTAAAVPVSQGGAMAFIFLVLAGVLALRRRMA